MFDFAGTLSKLPLFLQGASVTLLVSGLGALLGLLIGLVLVLCRRQPLRLVRIIAAIYVSFMRGTPILVQIFLVYYALPGLIGIDLDAFTAGVLALGMNSGAFISEIIRGGLSAIPQGHFDAAKALALPRSVTWGRIVLPEVFRLTVAPLMNEFTLLVKASPLLSVISVVELTRTAQNIMNETYRPIEAFLVAAVVYFLMLFALSWLSRRLERRMDLEVA